MSNRAKVAAIAVGVLLVAVAAYWALADNDLPGGGVLSPDPATCPLTGQEPKKQAALSRPAVAMKIENAAVAYPLSGLERADIVYEELVEGGITRFMAIYHCSDTAKAGPIRSARLVDPAIMKPATHILGFSGGNNAVLEELRRNDIVMVVETNADGAMQRVPREGLAIEHTLYADSAGVRRIGSKEFDEPPATELEFGDLEGNSKRARTITITFSSSTTVTYEWNGKRWARSQGGTPFETETYGQIGVENVMVEEHTLKLSEIVDVTGTPSTEIADETGSGRAVLFRDARAIVGTWTRDSADEPTAFETKTGDKMILKPGNTWVHLVPNARSEVEGSWDYAAK